MRVQTLRAPLTWWLLVAGLAASVWVVLVAVLPWWAALGIAVVVAAALAAALAAAGEVRVGVRDGEVVAGRAHVPLTACGEVVALDADATRGARGPEADATAFTLLRPWVRTAVRVPIVDGRASGDPTPYWLVSARDPERFVEAVRTARRDGAR